MILNTMIELRKDSKTMIAAIERARFQHPKIRVCGNRLFEVQGSDRQTWYQVAFAVAQGKRLASCTCRGAERGSVCYHMAAAAAVNIGMQRLAQRQLNEERKAA